MPCCGSNDEDARAGSDCDYGEYQLRSIRIHSRIWAPLGSAGFNLHVYVYANVSSYSIAILLKFSKMRALQQWVHHIDSLNATLKAIAEWLRRKRCTIKSHAINFNYALNIRIRIPERRTSHTRTAEPLLLFFVFTTNWTIHSFSSSVVGSGVDCHVERSHNFCLIYLFPFRTLSTFFIFDLFIVEVQCVERSNTKIIWKHKYFNYQTLLVSWRV